MKLHVTKSAVHLASDLLEDRMGTDSWCEKENQRSSFEGWASFEKASMTHHYHIYSLLSVTFCIFDVLP